ncbi:MAG: histidine triad nucleotide-binding protein [Chrysiogenetes bacterium]|nr:histidine triad nucleotide-binding protein [Chrysiogenetes bacterium]
MSECLFCRIVTGEIPAEKLHEDEHTIAFRDINPQAPTHFLVIPKKHIETLLDVTPEDHELMGRLVHTANTVAKAQGVDKAGFRAVVNCREQGGQTVYHLHLHVLGGRFMKWPPG